MKKLVFSQCVKVVFVNDVLIERFVRGADPFLVLWTKM